MLRNKFSSINLAHQAGAPNFGDAAYQVISKQDFAIADDEIKKWQGYQPTPLVTLPNLANRLEVERIDYKDEGSRFGLGSFKALGGAYAAMRVLQRELEKRLGHSIPLEDIRNGKYRAQCAAITLVSATDGNHGRSLAWGCQNFGAACRIYIHAQVSESRERAIKEFGAQVIRVQDDYDASVIAAKTQARENGWFVVSDTSWPGYSDPPRDVMAGYGTMTNEICEALERPPTHVFLQGGVGGLAASLAAGLRQQYGAEAPIVIIVEPELAACLFKSAQKGKASEFKITEETIMAGLSCGEPSPIAWQILREEASHFLTIPDAIIAPTIRLLANAELGDPVINAGESAVAGLSALIAARFNEAIWQKLQLDTDSRILLIGSEGVTDATIFDAIMKG